MSLSKFEKNYTQSFHMTEKDLIRKIEDLVDRTDCSVDDDVLCACMIKYAGVVKESFNAFERLTSYEAKGRIHWLKKQNKKLRDQNRSYRGALVHFFDL